MKRENLVNEHIIEGSSFQCHVATIFTPSTFFDCSDLHGLDLSLFRFISKL